MAFKDTKIMITIVMIKKSVYVFILVINSLTDVLLFDTERWCFLLCFKISLCVVYVAFFSCSGFEFE